MVVAAAALLAVGGGVATYQYWAGQGNSESFQPGGFAYVRNLEPGSMVSYTIIGNMNDGDVLKGEAVVDAQGIAELPVFEAGYKRYDITFRQDNKPVNLQITHNAQTGRLQIAGKGFEQFSDVFVSSRDDARSMKADWAGLYKDDVGFSDENGLLKLAFNAFGGAMPDSVENPSRVEVVIGVGGGPTNANVNIYNPRIHEANCGQPQNSTDGEDVFYVSTCDQARMAADIEGTGLGTMAYLIVQPMMMMANQLSAVMMQQMQIIGSFFDAKDHMDATREFRHLVTQAHKEYHPSEQMCHFGSSVRSLSHSDEWAQMSKLGLNKILNDYYRNVEHMSSSEGAATDVGARLAKFKSVYCDPNDNSGSMWAMCRGETYDPASPPTNSDSAEDRNRYNKDIDYFRTLGKPLTLEVNFTNNEATSDEEDVIALAKNLYWPKAQGMPDSGKFAEGFEEDYRLYLATRSIDTLYNLAHNSYINLVGMKSSTADPLGIQSGPAYMKSMMQNFGLSDEDIEEVMGADSSYYAQMEYLTKKLYQDPNFYTALYDKPVNVDRINVTLEAIQLMHGRDRFDSLLRQEMLVSALVEATLLSKVRDVNARVSSLGGGTRPNRPAGFAAP